MRAWLRRQWRAYVVSYRASRDAARAGARFPDAVKRGMDASAREIR